MNIIMRRDHSWEDEQQLPRILLERCYFIFFYQQRWSLAVMSVEPPRARNEIRARYWHTLVGFDDRTNRALGLHVGFLEWGGEEPDWEDVYRQRLLRLTGRRHLPPSVLSRRVTRW